MTVTEETVPGFARGHRLQHDRVRDVWVVQAPEKAFIVEGAAPQILALVDGERSVAAMIETLTEQFSAAREVISADVFALLLELAEKGVLRA